MNPSPDPIAQWELAARVTDAGDGVVDGMARFTLRQTLFGIAGDYNGDAVVDMADHRLWLETFGSTERLLADGNANGIIDAGDDVIWRDALNPAARLTASTAAVPEPTTGGLAILAAGFAAYWASRRRK
jgi:hypothetical protein